MLVILYAVRILVSRTNRAVLAVNGFAADGNMFVKTVRQRLEVRNPFLHARSYAHNDTIVDN